MRGCIDEPRSRRRPVEAAPPAVLRDKYISEDSILILIVSAKTSNTAEMDVHINQSET
jgi:hypothetical protein